MLSPMRGLLVEYGLSLPPLFLLFELNPQSISRSRSIRLQTGSAPGTRSGYDFTLPNETPRAAQGVEVVPETFNLTLLLDATDRMNGGDPIASVAGVLPELDTLRSMVEPKSQGPAGLQVLSSLGLGGQRAFQRNEHASVLLLVWGVQILPVFMTSVSIEEQAHLPTLIPYRAQATLGFQVIESKNPFYMVEKIRQTVGAALNLASGISVSITASFGASFG